MTTSYFVISASGGGTRIEKLTKKELLENFAGHYYGEDVKMACDLPNNDPNYWGDTDIIIIKGEIVLPKGVKTVTAWEVD
ncbi:hypothetical protein LCGC14_2598380 [marine sediment metagenome]|uniref:Uncharacterized protein n=1 Tax=marine sediment metagenome TaxID=412755 RepID=A0A0F9AXE2_9ZZZZ